MPPSACEQRNARTLYAVHDACVRSRVQRPAGGPFASTVGSVLSGISTAFQGCLLIPFVGWRRGSDPIRRGALPFGTGCGAELVRALCTRERHRSTR